MLAKHTLNLALRRMRQLRKLAQGQWFLDVGLHQCGDFDQGRAHRTDPRRQRHALPVAGIAHMRDDELACNRRACARRSEEHTSELQSLMRISYAVFCLKKKNHNMTIT